MTLLSFCMVLVFTFFLLGYSSKLILAAESSDEAYWPVDGETSGPSLPPAGRSLFDYLLIEPTGRFDIPFPLSKLLAKIADKTGHPVDTSGKSAIKIALIPIGRSLQRFAADPDFFEFPRAIYAFTGSPQKQGDPNFHVTDRLYIAYQERAEALEVISYNEQAGRYEFQVITDYASGKEPLLEYAERSVCIGCHQNHAPIFATAPWDETGANQIVAEGLARFGGMRHGIPVKVSLDVADLLDQSTDRANKLPLLQTLWSGGCPEVDDPDILVKCRAALLLSSLRFALSGFVRAPAAVDEVDRVFRRNLQRSFQIRWPGGIAESNPDIPNRNFDSYLRNPGSGIHALLEPEGPHNPLALRRHKKIWKLSTQMDPAFEQIMAGFSRILAAQDFDALDAALKEKKPGSSQEYYTADCSADHVSGTGDVPEIRTECALKNAGGEIMTLSLFLKMKGQHVTGGEITRLTLENGVSLFGLPLSLVGSGALGAGVTKISLSVNQRKSGRSARLPGANRLDNLVVTFHSWPAKKAHHRITLSLTEFSEGKMLEQTVASMIELTVAEGINTKRALSNPVLQRMAVYNEIMAGLGAEARLTCCAAAQSMPAPQVEGN